MSPFQTWMLFIMSGLVLYLVINSIVNVKADGWTRVRLPHTWGDDYDYGYEHDALPVVTPQYIKQGSHLVSLDEDAAGCSCGWYGHADEVGEHFAHPQRGSDEEWDALIAAISEEEGEQEDHR